MQSSLKFSLETRRGVRGSSGFQKIREELEVENEGV